MSKDTCETCAHYSPYPLRGYFHGECTDPTKIIYVDAVPLTYPPEVFGSSWCKNHEGETDPLTCINTGKPISDCPCSECVEAGMVEGGGEL